MAVERSECGDAAAGVDERWGAAEVLAAVVRGASACVVAAVCEAGAFVLGVADRVGWADDDVGAAVVVDGDAELLGAVLAGVEEVGDAGEASGVDDADALGSGVDFSGDVFSELDPPAPRSTVTVAVAASSPASLVRTMLYVPGLFSSGVVNDTELYDSRIAEVPSAPSSGPAKVAVIEDAVEEKPQPVTVVVLPGAIASCETVAVGAAHTDSVDANALAVPTATGPTMSAEPAQAIATAVKGEMRRAALRT